MAYTKNTNFTAKDALATGNPSKIIKGSELDTEFDEIATESAKAVEKASNNTISGDNTFSGNNTFSGDNTFTGSVYFSKGADIASATALALGTDGNYFDVTGTTAITSINTWSVGAVVKLHFDGAVTLTHHATDLILPGGANITTAAGDEFEFVEYASGDWRCTGYALANGGSPTGPSLAANNVWTGSNEYDASVYYAKGADVASASALALGTDGNYFDVTGTTAITSINTWKVGGVAKLHFDGALTLTHHATDLILPSGANITTAAGDEAEFVEYASGDWRCTSYTKASGEAVAGGGAWELISSTSITAVANLDVTIDETTYNAFRVVIEDGIPATDGATCRARLLYSNGASVESGSGYYTIENGTETTVLTYWQVDGNNGVGTAAGEGISLSCEVATFATAYGGASMRLGSAFTLASGAISGVEGGGYCKVANRAYDGARFYWSSGNWEANGTIKLYGLKRA